MIGLQGGKIKDIEDFHLQSMMIFKGMEREVAW